MAFREIRLYFNTGNKEQDRKLNGEISQPFEWFFDSVMRGQFKKFSGSEVKGTSLVNLLLFTKQCGIPDYGQTPYQEWIKLGNGYNCHSEFSIEQFEEERIANVRKGILLFFECATKSDLPQMKLLVEESKAKLSEDSLNQAIEKADDYWRAIMGERRTRVRNRKI